jgi:glucokinase
MSTRLEHQLLGDIGATNARFALLANGVIGPVEWLEVAQYARFTDAVGAFLNEHCCQLRVTTALLAVAGPVEGGCCALTNSSWMIDADELRATFGLAKVRVINDFEATAFALPGLTAEHLHALGGGRAVPGAPMAVLGPGSGLGVACLVPNSRNPIVIASEGGHATLAATSRREEAVIDHLRQRFGHVSAERVVSGSGLENIYQTICALDGMDAPLRNAAEITQAALNRTCPTAHAALDAFCALFGSIAGNVALMFGARGGVYIAGGIAPRIAKFMARSEFRARFESKGRFRPYLEAIPSNVIMHPATTFIGLKSLAERDSSTSA